MNFSGFLVGEEERSPRRNKRKFISNETTLYGESTPDESECESSEIACLSFEEETYEPTLFSDRESDSSNNDEPSGCSLPKKAKRRTSTKVGDNEKPCMEAVTVSIMPKKPYKLPIVGL
uniref:Cyclin-dependent kinase inhibitor n=1 Tax=Parastrongyloides trichosuri TaxID=131310 RepID=A0A0N4ZEN9_PARTI